MLNKLKYDTMEDYWRIKKQGLWVFLKVMLIPMPIDELLLYAEDTNQNLSKF